MCSSKKLGKIKFRNYRILKLYFAGRKHAKGWRSWDGPIMLLNVASLLCGSIVETLSSSFSLKLYKLQFRVQQATPSLKQKWWSRISVGFLSKSAWKFREFSFLNKPTWFSVKYNHACKVHNRWPKGTEGQMLSHSIES